MSKLDNIFLRIIQDEEFEDTIGNEATRVENLEDGKKSLNKHIRAIAEILDQLNKKLATVRSDMHVKGKTGNIVIDDAEYQAVYRKIVSLLSK